MNKLQTTNVRCFTCDYSLQISVLPVLVYVPGEGQQLRPPKLAAPFLCITCLQEPAKLKAAREEMFKYIGPEQTQGGFDG